jgi:hypothetical protein
MLVLHASAEMWVMLSLTGERAGTAGALLMNQTDLPT